MTWRPLYFRIVEGFGPCPSRYRRGVERKWWTLIAVCAATFMLLLDITVVNVALPEIQKSLDASFTELQWVVDAYSLMLAALLLTAGSLGDLLGRRRVFVAGLALFSLASLMCGLAPDATTLDVFRGLQGVGGAAMFALSLALIAQEFQGKDRATAFGAWGATTGGAVAVGPLVGGILTDTLGWEWIFFVNVPVGIATAWLALAKLVDAKAPEAQAIDWPGVVTFSSALFALVFGLIRGNEEGWGSPVIVALLGGSVLLLLAFVVIERRSAHPMFDLGLFRIPTFVGASIAAFALSASMFSMFLYLTLYVQTILGYDALQAGLRFLPITLLSFLVAPIAGRLSERFPARAFLGAGLVCVGVGLLLMHGVTPESEWTTLLAGFVVAGVGIGMVNPPLASTAIAVVQPARSGMASGINSTFRQVGIATGIAALGAVFQHRIQSELIPNLRGTPAEGRSHELSQAVAGGGTQQIVDQAPPAVRSVVARNAEAAFIAGLNEILLIAAGIAFAGAVLSFVLVRRADVVAQRGPEGAPASEAAPAG
jgi:EmrB/QacA subfamily drug resistance transporter